MLWSLELFMIKTPEGRAERAKGVRELAPMGRTILKRGSTGLGSSKGEGERKSTRRGKFLDFKGQRLTWRYALGY